MCFLHHNQTDRTLKTKTANDLPVRVRPRYYTTVVLLVVTKWGIAHNRAPLQQAKFFRPFVRIIVTFDTSRSTLIDQLDLL